MEQEPDSIALQIIYYFETEEKDGVSFLGYPEESVEDICRQYATDIENRGMRTRYVFEDDSVMVLDFATLSWGREGPDRFSMREVYSDG